MHLIIIIKIIKSSDKRISGTTNKIYSAKINNESRVHYSPEPARGLVYK